MNSRVDDLLHGELDEGHTGHGPVCLWTTVGVFGCLNGRVCPGMTVDVVG